MADKTPDPAPEGTSGLLAGIARGLAGAQISIPGGSLAGMAKAGWAPINFDAEPDPEEGPTQNTGQIAGRGDSPKKRRGRRGKVTNVGGHRVVNYYEWTKHELDILGTKRTEATRSIAIAAFFLGLVIDGAKDLILNPPTSDTAKGVWGTLLVISIAAMIYYALEGWRRTMSAKTFLQEIKDEHDFEE